MNRLRDWKNTYRRDEGISMVMIVVLIAFLAILMSVLMTTTMAAYRMKISEARGRVNFYQAERALEEERAEIADKVSYALATSYLAVTEDFTSLSAPARATRFRERFREALLSRMEEGRDIDVYEDRVVIRDYTAEHTDADGYHTTIKTDIAILIPDEAYWRTHAVMEVGDLVIYENYTEQ